MDNMKNYGSVNGESQAISSAYPSLKVQAIAAFIAAVAAVALPQALHMFGAAAGIGTLGGETFLPMHLPVIAAGFLAGPYAGAAAGMLSPAASAALTGMPLPAMLPFMTIELFIYGLTAGVLRNSEDGHLGIAAKVLTVQIVGRAVRALAILLNFYVLGNTAVAPAVIWNSVIAGLPGVVIQLILIPLVCYSVYRRK